MVPNRPFMQLRPGRRVRSAPFFCLSKTWKQERRFWAKQEQREILLLLREQSVGVSARGSREETSYLFNKGNTVPFRIDFCCCCCFKGLIFFLAALSSPSQMPYCTAMGVVPTKWWLWPQGWQPEAGLCLCGAVLEGLWDRPPGVMRHTKGWDTTDISKEIQRGGQQRRWKTKEFG